MSADARHTASASEILQVNVLLVSAALRGAALGNRAALLQRLRLASGLTKADWGQVVAQATLQSDQSAQALQSRLDFLSHDGGFAAQHTSSKASGNSSFEDAAGITAWLQQEVDELGTVVRYHMQQHRFHGILDAVVVEAEVPRKAPKSMLGCFSGGHAAARRIYVTLSLCNNSGATGGKPSTETAHTPAVEHSARSSWGTTMRPMHVYNPGATLRIQVREAGNPVKGGAGQPRAGQAAADRVLAQVHVSLYSVAALVEESGGPLVVEEPLTLRVPLYSRSSSSRWRVNGRRSSGGGGGGGDHDAGSDAEETPDTRALYNALTRAATGTAGRTSKGSVCVELNYLWERRLPAESAEQEDGGSVRPAPPGAPSQLLSPCPLPLAVLRAMPSGCAGDPDGLCADAAHKLGLTLIHAVWSLWQERALESLVGSALHIQETDTDTGTGGTNTHNTTARQAAVRRSSWKPDGGTEAKARTTNAVWSPRAGASVAISVLAGMEDDRGSSQQQCHPALRHLAVLPLDSVLTAAMGSPLGVQERHATLLRQLAVGSLYAELLRHFTIEECGVTDVPGWDEAECLPGRPYWGLIAASAELYRVRGATVHLCLLAHLVAHWPRPSWRVLEAAYLLAAPLAAAQEAGLLTHMEAALYVQTMGALLYKIVHVVENHYELYAASQALAGRCMESARAITSLAVAVSIAPDATSRLLHHHLGVAVQRRLRSMLQPPHGIVAEAVQALQVRHPQMSVDDITGAARRPLTAATGVMTAHIVGWVSEMLTPGVDMRSRQRSSNANIKSVSLCVSGTPRTAQRAEDEARAGPAAVRKLAIALLAATDDMRTEAALQPTLGGTVNLPLLAANLRHKALLEEVERCFSGQNGSSAQPLSDAVLCVVDRLDQLQAAVHQAGLGSYAAQRPTSTSSKHPVALVHLPGLLLGSAEALLRDIGRKLLAFVDQAANEAPTASGGTSHSASTAAATAILPGLVQLSVSDLFQRLHCLVEQVAARMLQAGLSAHMTRLSRGLQQVLDCAVQRYMEHVEQQVVRAETELHHNGTWPTLAAHQQQQSPASSSLLPSPIAALMTTNPLAYRKSHSQPLAASDGSTASSGGGGGSGAADVDSGGGPAGGVPIGPGLCMLLQCYHDAAALQKALEEAVLAAANGAQGAQRMLTKPTQEAPEATLSTHPSAPSFGSAANFGSSPGPSFSTPAQSFSTPADQSSSSPIPQASPFPTSAPRLSESLLLVKQSLLHHVGSQLQRCLGQGLATLLQCGGGGSSAGGAQPGETSPPDRRRVRGAATELLLAAMKGDLDVLRAQLPRRLLREVVSAVWDTALDCVRSEALGRVGSGRTLQYHDSRALGRAMDIIQSTLAHGSVTTALALDAAGQDTRRLVTRAASDTKALIAQYLGAVIALESMTDDVQPEEASPLATLRGVPTSRPATPRQHVQPLIPPLALLRLILQRAASDGAAASFWRSQRRSASSAAMQAVFGRPADETVLFQAACRLEGVLGSVFVSRKTLGFSTLVDPPAGDGSWVNSVELRSSLSGPASALQWLQSALMGAPDSSRPSTAATLPLPHMPDTTVAVPLVECLSLSQVVDGPPGVVIVLQDRRVLCLTALSAGELDALVATVRRCVRGWNSPLDRCLQGAEGPPRSAAGAVQLPGGDAVRASHACRWSGPLRHCEGTLHLRSASLTFMSSHGSETEQVAYRDLVRVECARDWLRGGTWLILASRCASGTPRTLHLGDGSPARAHFLLQAMRDVAQEEAAR